jgi:hypothetical protein
MGSTLAIKWFLLAHPLGGRLFGFDWLKVGAGLRSALLTGLPPGHCISKRGLLARWRKAHQRTA